MSIKSAVILSEILNR